MKAKYHLLFLIERVSVRFLQESTSGGLPVFHRHGCSVNGSVAKSAAIWLHANVHTALPFPSLQRVQ